MLGVYNTPSEYLRLLPSAKLRAWDKFCFEKSDSVIEETDYDRHVASPGICLASLSDPSPSVRRSDGVILQLTSAGSGTKFRLLAPRSFTRAACCDAQPSNTSKARLPRNPVTPKQ